MTGFRKQIDDNALGQKLQHADALHYILIALIAQSRQQSDR